MNPRGGVKEESWADFHARHHSETYRFSCNNERILKQGCAPFCWEEPEGNGWFTSFLESLVGTNNQVKVKQPGVVVEDTSWSTGSGTGSSSSKRRKRSIFRKEKPQGNIKLKDIRYDP